MGGLGIKIPGIFTDSNLPLMPTYDAIETPSLGSLLLMEPSRSDGYDFGTTIPTSNTRINNILWQKAASLIGSGDKTTLSPTVLQSNFNSNEGFVEFTTKKGIHACVSQVNNIAYHAFVITLPTAIKNYILANPNHKYFISMWGRRTRAALTTGGSTASVVSFIANNAQATSNYLYAFSSWQNIPGTTINPTSFISERDSNHNSVGNFLKNMGVNQITGTITSMDAALFVVGSFGAWANFSLNKASSDILYKFYIEDLTVSGRSYADVDIIDKNAYDVAFGVGGKYYGDTFSSVIA